jgi:sugar phosphate isomerase/epimerase
MLMTRRSFVRRSSLTLGAAVLVGRSSSPMYARPLGWPIGFQTWVVRDVLAKDFKGTLQKMAAMGYQTMEMCSPPEYADSGFGPLAGLKAAEMRRIIEDSGLKCESCHYPFEGLKANLDERIAFAKELGLTQMVISSFWMKDDAKLTDWQRQCDLANPAGDKVQKAGMQLGFHNHNFEVKQLEGVLIYDALMARFDPKLVKMQFQVAVISEGFEAATFFNKYPGRFISMHLADWSPAEKKAVPIGQGIVDWKKLFAAAKTGVVKNYFVEMDLPTLKPSCDYLQKLEA